MRNRVFIDVRGMFNLDAEDESNFLTPRLSAVLFKACKGSIIRLDYFSGSSRCR